MKNIKEIESELSSAKPGTVIEIKGYTDSKGDVRDVTAELASEEVYQDMQKEDLRILEEADVADLAGDDGLGDLQLTDMITARQQIMTSRATSLQSRESGEMKHRGPVYARLGGSLAKHPDKPDTIYIQRVIITKGLSEKKPAKGAVPRAKQKLTVDLKLPTRQYSQNLKFEDGSFESISIKKLV